MRKLNKLKLGRESLYNLSSEGTRAAQGGGTNNPNLSCGPTCSCVGSCLCTAFPGCNTPACELY